MTGNYWSHDWPHDQPDKLGWPDWPEWPDQPFPWDGIQEGQWENHCHAQCNAPMTWHVPYMPIYAHLRGQKFIGNNLISANEDQVQRGNSLQSLGENFASSFFSKDFKVKNSVWICISQLTVPVRSSWPNIWFKITHPTLPIILRLKLYGVRRMYHNWYRFVL